MESQTSLRKRAKDCAEYFGLPYVVFMDTSLNWRMERYDESLTCHREGTLYFPRAAALAKVSP